MHRIKILAVLAVWCGITTFLYGLGVPASAKTRIPADVESQVSEKTIKEIESTFTNAEKAINEGDLDAVMMFYSNRYEYHGLKKEDLRNIWQDLFAKYRRIDTTHILSKFVVKEEGKDKIAEVTCTGNLWATSKSSNKRENIDS